ncbi:hypothetical protein EHQ24_08140 [Leptospira noumeaensis]|uniref:Uncharacterized protein n=1 Tax=Leptospira noumeaensis TaxID=2484964 RepID=A0A4R9I960_9LEPT|nr:hypothetical protein [Leptospira noumeaensis]TGK82982.1 hypothetical protein EHQ24_08140 [Leptospira noumeaensis]
MPINLDIPANSIEYFSTEAIEELRDATLNYSLNIIDEANRLDATIRSKKDKPEITRSIVKNAVNFRENPFNIRKKSLKYILIQIASSIFLFLSGITYDFQKFSTDKLHLASFLVITLIAITSTVSMFFMGRDEI